MALITGSPYGTITASEDIYLSDAPYIYFQDATASPFFNPDSDGYYWQVSGTATYPVFEFACVEGVTFTEGRTLNDVTCDNVGVKDTVQTRDYVEFQLSVKSLFPFTNLSRILAASAATINASQNTEKIGIGKINNNQFWHVYAPKVYDEDVGDYVAIHLHKAKFVNSWTIEMPYANQWSITGLALRGFADTTKPTAQQFAVVVRHDPSVL